ncbi:MAG: S4 domain-containing protein, partial [Gaiellaceae bacterium]
YFTYLDPDEIGSLETEQSTHPARRAAQHALANEVCTTVHGADEARRAAQASRALFGEEITTLDEATLLEVVADVPSSTLARDALARGEVTLLDALVECRLVASRGAARRALAQGGIYLNNRRVDNEGRRFEDADLLHGRYVVLRRGRRDYHVLVAR